MVNLNMIVFSADLVDNNLENICICSRLRMAALGIHLERHRSVVAVALALVEMLVVVGMLQRKIHF